MNAQHEYAVKKLVFTHRHQLVERAEVLVAEDRRMQAYPALKPARGNVIFKQLLEGCWLTLAFSERNSRELVILDWCFPEPRLN